MNYFSGDPPLPCPYLPPKVKSHSCGSTSCKHDFKVNSDIHAPQQCFIDTHSLFNSTFVWEGSAEQTVIEDVTCNHNKTLLILTSMDPDVSSGDTAQTIEVTIQTRGCNKPITAVIAPSAIRAFQVENFKKLVVKSLSGPAAAIQIIMQKTFCICCEEKEDFNRLSKKSNLFSNRTQINECFIGTHQLNNISNTLPAGSTQIFFEDFTCNHNKALLELRSTAQQVAVSIKTRDCNTPITVIVDPSPSLGLSSRRSIQVENLERLSITNLGSGSTTFILAGVKTFCICCNDKENNQNCEDCCNICDCCDNKEKCHTCKLCNKCSCSCNQTNL
ncbi:hypothetical protein CN373_24495 [Bacillus cereus]|uniref:hypothetical protein n=1 Tax=Bacillus cereus TaxID=1396 RepID=UPI000BF274A8|nr:hypothetical protein [Bacillus cereus]PFA13228.1 hypothetical protein CN373_24495 [Bacillus cereus]PFR21360.1 hypothetical protein COK19_21940 [Bacillus cereus]PGZ12218.1 hypothetical protein COE46_24620 [Bacillus cereus]